MFLDRVKISCKAGCGGNGSVSFHRDKMTANGGPDGGNGGKGGDVYFVATGNLNTLYSFKFKKKWIAGDGECGGKKMSSGKSGADLIIEVPVGTVIREAKEGRVLADMSEDGKKVRILCGGKGGRGNAFYATSTRQSPHFSQSGEQTEAFEILLELKTIADVGLVGFPNVGKSTLLSVITNARPKIANYHFTTVVPNLGVVQHGEDSFVVADIPGLIEGASEGAGLGHYFLRHIERVRVIVHMVDISACEDRDPYEDYIKINEELAKYSAILSKLEQILVFTKTDLLLEEELEQNIAAFMKKLNQKIPHLCISSVAHRGLEQLKNQIWNVLERTPKPAPFEVETEQIDRRDTTSLFVDREGDVFVVSGGLVDNLIRGIVLSDPASFAYFQKRLKDDGIHQMLLDEGIAEGDMVRIKDMEFEFVE